MTSTIESACTITKRELDHKPGAVEINISILMDEAHSGDLITNLVLNFHQKGIVYVPQNIYREILER